MQLAFTLVGLVLTLLVFSYLFGDNFLFRLGSYIFVGVSAGYVSVILIYEVLFPRLIAPFISGNFSQMVLALIPLILSLLLLTKLSPRFSSFGNVSMGYLVGMGAATLVGGAVLGTIIGQVRGVINGFDLRLAVQAGQNPTGTLVESVVFLFGTISTLIYFQFGVRASPDQPPARPAIVEILAGVGKIFIAITLGALFAGILVAAITAMIDRLDFITETLYGIFF